MLLFGKRLTGTPVMSLQIGAQAARTVRPVIDPFNLVIVAYEVNEAPTIHGAAYIRIADIRELSDLGMIVDSADELIGRDDVIAIKNLLDIDFQIVGMKVVDTRGRRLGRVEDYTVDTDSFVIQQISVRSGIIGSLSKTGHMIHRSQIVEISDTTITVKALEKQLTTLETEGDIHRTYANPFRKIPEIQTEASLDS